MAKICIQLQPHRAPELSPKEIRSALETIGATPRLVERHWVEEGEKDGPYLHFTFETRDPGELWGLIEDDLFREPPWGRLARKASIVTCDDLILHHFDPAVDRAS
ncbi:MAG: hypothetical protein EHM91_10065, partial [Planctomycetota bacterium]